MLLSWPAFWQAVRKGEHHEWQKVLQYKMAMFIII